METIKTYKESMKQRHRRLFEKTYVSIYIFNLYVYPPHMRENLQPSIFGAGLASLNMNFSSSIHLSVNNRI
jgi:hypothetical protein